MSVDGDMPATGDDYAEDVVLMAVEKRGGLRMPDIDIDLGRNKPAKMEAPSPPPPPPPPASPSPTAGPGRHKSPEPPADKPAADRGTRSTVTAVQLTAVIPTQGNPLRYEHLLLEAGAAHSLPIDARLPRRNR